MSLISFVARFNAISRSFINPYILPLFRCFLTPVLIIAPNRYGRNDKTHYEGFRFIAPNKHAASPDDKPFFPNSDMAFGEFKKAIKKEWYTHQLEKMK
jgi:hypothetical protein